MVVTLVQWMNDGSEANWQLWDICENVLQPDGGKSILLPSVQPCVWENVISVKDWSFIRVVSDGNNPLDLDDQTTTADPWSLYSRHDLVNWIKKCPFVCDLLYHFIYLQLHKVYFWYYYFDRSAQVNKNRIWRYDTDHDTRALIRYIAIYH